jgi:radical SAM superfamily enzyme YgiQ (UPF0313 family)
MPVDVLIGQSYFLRFDPTLWAAQRPYAPLGSLYAASCVREAGCSVALFDAMLADSEQQWDEAIDREQPAVAVLFEDSFNYLSKMCLLRMREAAMTMIAAARRRGIPVLIAGSDATDHPLMYLDAGAHAVIVGEGELTLVEALIALRAGIHDLATVAGLVMKRDGAVLRTPARSVLRDLDRMPRPAWDLVDLERYREVWQRRHGTFSMNIATTRGCPYHCNWCAKPIYGQRYTARSPQAVAEEIAWLAASYHPDHLWVTDDIFGLKPGWIEAFAQALARTGRIVPFKCLMRADGITASVAEALRDSGCRTVWIGAESGSQRILDAMEKGTRVDQIETAARLLRGAGIEVGFFLQFGYPGETLSEIEETLAMIRRCAPDDIGISVSYPLPGTPFYERVRAQLGAKQNWVDSADLAMMYRATYEPPFYKLLHQFAHARFRTDRGLRTLRTLLRAPQRIGRRDGVALVDAARAAVRLPWLKAQMRRAARSTATREPTAVPLPLLNRQAAAVPSEQHH